MAQSWRVITETGSVHAISGRTAAESFVRCRTLNYIIDSTNKTIYCIPDDLRLELLKATDAVLSKRWK